MTPNLIEVRNLVKVYETEDGELVALDDVSFDMREGEFLALVGPSGCGKSTLLKIIAGIVPATEGSITLRGRPFTKVAEGVALVFQQPVLLPWRRVLDNVLLPMDVAGLRSSATVKRAHDLLETVGLSSFERRYPQELSVGMQQRLSIARAFIGDPEILLMDEPFSALDAMLREQLGWELMRIHAESGKTILFVTHSIIEAVLLADRVIVMTPRPGHLDEAVEVSLPRPRTPETLVTKQFGAYYTHIRKKFGGKAPVQ